MKKLILFSVVALVAIFASCKEEDPLPKNLPYYVEIIPDHFVNTNIVGNEYFLLEPGRTMVYLGEDEDGEAIRVEKFNTYETKEIMGVTCAIVRTMEYKADELIEDTYDWYAQDKEGTVWYFGEDSKQLENGIVVGTDGSWEADVNGALPGIIMHANPLDGLYYVQGYYEGEEEDVAEILSRNAMVTVPYGTFNKCIQIAEWDLLQPEIVKHKFYVQGIGLIRTVAVKGESGYEDLVEIN